MLPRASSMSAAIPTRILDKVKPTMQARVVVLVALLVMMTDLVAALAMTTTMGLAMAMMMTMLAAIRVATVRGSARRKAVVAIIVAKEAGQKITASAQYAGCRQDLLEKAVGARRKKVRLHMSRLQDFKALWRVWGSFGSGGAGVLFYRPKLGEAAPQAARLGSSGRLSRPPGSSVCHRGST